MTRPPLAPALLAEFLGTALLVLMGDGVVASVVLMGKQADWIVITAGWGLAVAVAVYVTGRISGGHLNPAVSLALASRGEFPIGRVVPYWTAQILGAMAGASILYLDYYVAFSQFEIDRGITRGQMSGGILRGSAAGGAGVFCNFPVYPGNLAGNFFSEVLGTAVLLFGIRALTDRRNAAPGRGFEPLLVGGLVMAIGLSLGGLTGYAINPARDFGPRVVACFAGWGRSVFASHDHYFWIPIVAPLVGGVVGIWLYDHLIAPFLPRETQEAPPGTVAP
jgi:glycerol uptake facilitator protein